MVRIGRVKISEDYLTRSIEQKIRAPVGRHLGRDKPHSSGYPWNGVSIWCTTPNNMKMLPRRNHWIPITTGLALVTSVCLAADPNSPTPTPRESSALSANKSPVPAMSPLNTASPFGDVQLRLRDLQSEMDKIFAQTFRGLGSSFGQSGFASSVDLREQNDKYVARIYLPNGDTSKVNATIKDGNLDIHMNAGAGENENFEQVITLPQPVRADEMQVERKPNMVVITVPKQNAAGVAQSSPHPAFSPGLASDWDQRMIDEMRQMEQRMNSVFQNGFGNKVFNGTNVLQLGSAVNVEDQKDKYVVHFALPTRDVSNVNVNYKDGELRLTASEQKETAKSPSTGTPATVERGRYEEMITLPGPVKEDEMQVNRQANAVVVTLPKA
jgi:HSP20 family molecular chaperone IbpA